MKIVQPMVDILYPKTPVGAMAELKLVEAAGRVCYKSEMGDDPQVFVKNLIARGHESPLEHAKMTARLVVDRGVANEIVRHRLASYSQESTRYCNYTKDKFDGEISFVDFSGAVQFDSTWSKLSFEQGAEAFLEWSTACKEAEEHYQKLVKLGVSPQLARNVLNLSTKTEIVMTANLREWRHFFNLRAANASGPAHPQMQQIARELLIEAGQLYPSVFEDILTKVYNEA